MSDRPRTFSAGAQAQRELDELGVEKRRAQLQAVRHAHPVGLHEQVVEQVGAQVEVQQAVQRLRLGRGLPDPAEVVERPVAVLAAAAQQRTAQRLVGEAQPREVGVG